MDGILPCQRRKVGSGFLAAETWRSEVNQPDRRQHRTADVPACESSRRLAARIQCTVSPRSRNGCAPSPRTNLVDSSHSLTVQGMAVHMTQIIVCLQIASGGWIVWQCPHLAGARVVPTRGVPPDKGPSPFSTVAACPRAADWGNPRSGTHGKLGRHRLSARCGWSSKQPRSER